MDIVDEVWLWGGLAIVFALVFSIFIPNFLQFLAGGDADSQTGLRKRFFWNGKDD